MSVNVPPTSAATLSLRTAGPPWHKMRRLHHVPQHLSVQRPADPRPWIAGPPGPFSSRTIARRAGLQEAHGRWLARAAARFMPPRTRARTIPLGSQQTLEIPRVILATDKRRIIEDPHMERDRCLDPFELILAQSSPPAGYRLL